ncbi:MAG: 3'-5' exonuclease [Gallionella sp.]
MTKAEPIKIAPSKAKTALLSPFTGLSLDCIFIPETKADFAAAVAEIKAAGIAGFDTESKPTFNRGEVSTGPHIVQFSINDKAFIFQLHRPHCQPYLNELLQSDDVLKVGFGLASDHGQIHNKLGVKLTAALDINTVFHRRGYNNSTGLRAAVAIVFNQKFHKNKKVTTSNWAQEKLTTKQLIYAANDAYVALQVQNALGGRHADCR